MWRIMENRCVCYGVVIPKGLMVGPICEMTADEIAVTDWPEGKEYGRQSASTNR